MAQAQLWMSSKKSSHPFNSRHFFFIPVWRSCKVVFNCHLKGQFSAVNDCKSIKHLCTCDKVTLKCLLLLLRENFSVCIIGCEPSLWTSFILTDVPANYNP